VSLFRLTGQDDPDDQPTILKEITIGFGNCWTTKQTYFLTAEKAKISFTDHLPLHSYLNFWLI
jgi:hypothetical protein